MTASLSADLYALRMLLANGREVTCDGSPVRLVIGWNQAAHWMERLEEAIEQLDQAAEEEDASPRPALDEMTRDDWLAELEDGAGRRRSNAELADRLGCNKTTVRRYLALHEIPTVLDEIACERLIPWTGANNGNNVAGVSGPGPLAAAGNGGDG